VAGTAPGWPPPEYQAEAAHRVLRLVVPCPAAGRCRCPGASPDVGLPHQRGTGCVLVQPLRGVAALSHFQRKLPFAFMTRRKLLPVAGVAALATARGQKSA